jgi:hypothetical protein
MALDMIVPLGNKTCRQNYSLPEKHFGLNFETPRSTNLLSPTPFHSHIFVPFQIQNPCHLPILY